MTLDLSRERVDARRLHDRLAGLGEDLHSLEVISRPLITCAARCLFSPASSVHIHHPLRTALLTTACIVEFACLPAARSSLKTTWVTMA